MTKRALLDVTAEALPSIVGFLLDAGVQVRGASESPTDGLIRLRLSGEMLPDACGDEGAAVRLVTCALKTDVYGSQRITRIVDWEVREGAVSA